ncbi:alpha/beta hydrolase [Halosquirtibacter xylanolyticus]|uniref:alpha/beta hydrolase n=1 Tax=Halosquirtibacter xylanolyticus TaxID=3374599 RepID=UPI003748F495|nr:alpha/beta hydrolase [Prolixibacteraceae bacterium]
MTRQNMLWFYLWGLILTGCKSEKDQEKQINKEVAPIVYKDSTFEVLLEKDIVYAHGLHHSSLNSGMTQSVPLKLDLYCPENHRNNRPAFLFLHGNYGSKEQDEIKQLANYFCARGWVFISADYRTLGELGTVPEEWVVLNESTPTVNELKTIALYPAHRDAKTAIRWIAAHAEIYDINPKHITIGGMSEGADIAITLGISEPQDFRDELTTEQDPSLVSTYIDQDYSVSTIIDLGGSKRSLDQLKNKYGFDRFDKNDPPMFIAHGTLNTLTPFHHATTLKKIYKSNKVPFAFYPMEGYNHNIWNGKIENQHIDRIIFNFIVHQQSLKVK